MKRIILCAILLCILLVGCVSTEDAKSVANNTECNYDNYISKERANILIDIINKQTDFINDMYGNDTLEQLPYYIISHS